MKLVNSSKLLTAACALSLAMGVAGTAQATHKGGAEHGQGNGKGPQLSINVETFCGDPLMVPAIDENGEVIYEDGNIVYDVIQGEDNVAVRVTNVSDDFDDGSEPGAPEIASIAVVCHEKGNVKNMRNVLDKPELSKQDGDLYLFECDVPGNVSEWKATAVVYFDKDGEGELEQKFDSCEEVAVP